MPRSSILVSVSVFASVFALQLAIGGSRASAQPYAQGYFAAEVELSNCVGAPAGSCPAPFYSVSGAGRLGPQGFVTFDGPTRPVDVSMDSFNRDMVINFTGRLVALTPNQTTPSTMISIAIQCGGMIPSQEGGMIVTNWAKRVIQVDRGYTYRPFGPALAGSEITLASSATRDLSTGDYLTGTFAGIRALSTDGLTLKTLTTAIRSSPGMTCSHVDGALFVSTGTGNTILRQLPGGAFTTFVSGPAAATLRIDRDGTLIAADGVGSPPTIWRLDSRTGAVLSTVTVSAMTSGPIATFCHAWGRNLSTYRIGAGNQWGFHLGFPNEARRGYVLGFSVSGFAPGFRVAGRRIALNLDSVLTQSVSGGLAPLLRNGVGALDANAEAVATLDLRAIPWTVTGVPLWAVALTLDPKAPNGIGTVSKPVVLVLE